MGRSYSQKTIKLLFGKSAARCAHPECKKYCIYPGEGEEDDTIVGEVGHIHAINKGGSRYDGDMSEKELNHYDNLILLCRNHHRLVDDQESEYPPDLLREWKEDHEEWAQEALQEEMPKVTFSEMDVVCQALLGGNVEPTHDFEVIDPEEKMRRNDLTESVRFELEMGMGKAPEVDAYVSHQEKVDPGFGSRLKAGFVEEYERLREDGTTGDELFWAMRDFAWPSEEEDFSYQAAALAILAYLFHKCEVFEK